MPQSATTRTAVSSSRRTLTSTFPALVLNFTALSRMLSHMRRSRARSPTTCTGSVTALMVMSR